MTTPREQHPPTESTAPTLSREDAIREASALFPGMDIMVEEPFIEGEAGYVLQVCDTSYKTIAHGIGDSWQAALDALKGSNGGAA